MESKSENDYLHLQRPLNHAQSRIDLQLGPHGFTILFTRQQRLV